MDRWPVAIGVLPGTDGAWVGVDLEEDGFRLIYGQAGGGPTVSSVSSDATRRQEVLTAAVAYFQEGLQEPPQELEAMQADLADVVRWLAAGEPEPATRAALAQAMDAIDDGLAGDAVVSRLNDAGAERGETPEQADAVSLLVSWYQALVASGS